MCVPKVIGVNHSSTADGVGIFLMGLLTAVSIMDTPQESHPPSRSTATGKKMNLHTEICKIILSLSYLLIVDYKGKPFSVVLPYDSNMIHSNQNV